ncbi:MAG TPA: hypothetical protein VF219_17305, partial [Vicinamibacterales bacterium]
MSSLAYILECPVLFVVKEKRPVPESHCQIRRPIIVIVAGRATNAAQCRIETRLLRYILELSAAKVAIESHASAR